MHGHFGTASRVQAETADRQFVATGGHTPWDVGDPLPSFTLFAFNQ